MDIFLEFEQDTQKIQKKIKVGKNIIQKNINEIIKDNNSIIIPLINLKNIYNLNYKLVFISFTVSVSILEIILKKFLEQSQSFSIIYLYWPVSLVKTLFSFKYWLVYLNRKIN